MENKPRIYESPLIPRQERFCRAFVHYGQAAAAAREAGYAPRSSNRQGWRLMRSQRIQARIREIQAELGRQGEQASAVMVGKLEVVYRRALGDHQFTAAGRAVQLQAQLMKANAAGAETDVESDALVEAPSEGPAPEMCTSGVQMRTGPPKVSQKYTSPDVSVPARLPAARRGG